MVPIARVGHPADVPEPGAGATEPPAVSPVLPDLEWAVSGALAVDLLDGHEFSGEERAADLRRARVGGAVLWDRTWAAALGADLAHSGALGQASVAYLGLPVHFEIGRFPEPFGLIQQQGSAGQLLMELPAGAALTPGYGLGLGASLSDSRHSVAVGAFAPTSTGDPIQRRPSDGAVTLRLTGIPVLTGSSLMHLGVAFSLRQPREEVIRFVALPETVLLKDLYVESAPLHIQRYTLLGLELGFLAGPLLLQAEGIHARIPAIEGARSNYYGGHVEAGWTFGGLGRGYSTARGIFGPTYSSRPLGEGGLGAVELTARYSYLDMRSNALGDLAASQDPNLREIYSGERSQAVAFGVNWYATDEVKLSFSGLDMEIESRSSTETATVYQARIQIQLRWP